MLKSVMVTNPSDDYLVMSLTEPEKSGFIIRSIEGLGPAKTNINIKGNSSASGSVFNSAQTPSRNIVFVLEFIASPTIEKTRLRSYQFFPNESKVTLDFTTDEGIFQIEGYVESNEPTIFSDKQAATISIMCPNPFFWPSTYVNNSGDIAAVSSLFEFPFSNETETPEIIFGERLDQTSQEIPITYTGTIAVGPILTLTAVGGAIVNPVIYFESANDPDLIQALKLRWTTQMPQLEDGDVLVIVCERGMKSVTRYHDTEEFNYLGTVTVDSDWPILKPGENTFTYEAESGAEFIRFGYEYPIRYIGI